MVSFEQADRVSKKISRKLKSPDWLLGIAMDLVNGSYTLVVRIERGKMAHVPKLPAIIDGVPVRVVSGGPVARPLPKRA